MLGTLGLGPQTSIVATSVLTSLAVRRRNRNNLKYEHGHSGKSIGGATAKRADKLASWESVAEAGGPWRVALLFNLLAGEIPRGLEPWNAWLAEFRSVLTDPDLAARKAYDELSTSHPDRIADFMAEVFAVIHLSRNGYSEFRPVLATSDQKQSVDFTARNAGQLVRIEVKHLREPEDIIRTVALKRWKLCRERLPHRYHFSLQLMHSHYERLSDAGIARLNTAIDQSPDFADDEYRLKLDNDVEIVLRRTPIASTDKPILAIQSGFGTMHFEFDLPELQSLFVKAFRHVSDSLLKFFGRQANSEAINLIAMQWEPAKMMHDVSAPKNVQQALEQAFASVGLRLRVVIFVAPPSFDSRFLESPPAIRGRRSDL